MLTAYWLDPSYEDSWALIWARTTDHTSDLEQLSGHLCLESNVFALGPKNVDRLLQTYPISLAGNAAQSTFFSHGSVAVSSWFVKISWTRLLNYTPCQSFLACKLMGLAEWMLTICFLELNWILRLLIYVSISHHLLIFSSQLSTTGWGIYLRSL